MAQRRRGLGCGGLIFAYLILMVICISVFCMSLGDSPKPDKPEVVEEIEEQEETKQEETEEQEDKEETTPEQTEQEETAEEETAEEETAEEPKKEENPAHRRMYEQLDETEKYIYEVIQDNIANGEEVIDIQNLEYDADKIWEHVQIAYDAVYYDCPEFFWLNHNWDASGQYQGDKINIEFTAICHDYWNYVLDKESYKDAVMSKAEQIASEAEKQPTTYDKVKYVHDYLVTNVLYDEVALAEIKQTVQRASNQQSHTAYGALVSNLAVCDGYAKSFQLIMNLLGIECEYIEGFAGEYHAWNYIKLDGDNYWMDVTWDDYNLKNADGSMMCPEGVNYEYYCITSENLYRTHEPDDTFAIPNCTATEYNFFRHEDAYLEEYDFDGVCNAMMNQKEEQIIGVQFGSLNEYNEALEDLITKNRRYYNISYFKDRDVEFYINEDQYSLTFAYPQR